MDSKEKLCDILEIIIPTYSRANGLKQTLETLLEDNSPLKDIDITVLDNASTDNTEEVVKSFLPSHPNLKYIRNNRNIGGNANIARIFERAKKKYVWGVCDNDKLHLEYWNEIEDALYKDYGVIFTQNIDNNLGHLHTGATFLPACIYRTDNITPTTMVNIEDNCRNMFPHLAVFSKAINDKKNIYVPNNDIVENLFNGSFSNDMYLRGCIHEEVPASRRYMHWTVAYYNSIELIQNRKTQLEILHNLHGTGTRKTSVLNWLVGVIQTNRIYYSNYLYNYLQMFRIMDFSLRIQMLIAFIKAYQQLPRVNKNFINLSEKEGWAKFFEYKKEQKLIDKLAKKYKNKKIILYGAGLIANILLDNYDMSKLNIVGISDKKFDGTETFKNYKTFSPENIKNSDADVIIFTLCNHKNIYKNLKTNLKCDTLITKPHFTFA